MYTFAPNPISLGGAGVMGASVGGSTGATVSASTVYDCITAARTAALKPMYISFFLKEKNKMLFVY